MTVFLSSVNTLLDMQNGNTFATKKGTKQKADNQPLHIDNIQTPEWWNTLDAHDANVLHYFYILKYPTHQG